MISIIVPIYNVDKYIDRCLNSIKSHTYTDFEVLMVDDGSTDKSTHIAKSFLQDNRFRYFYQENSGQAAARNLGLDNVRGKYVCFIDSDDYIENDYLQILLKTLKENDADIAQCGVSRVWENGRKRSLYSYKISSAIYTDIKNYILSSSFACWNKIYKVELFKNLRFPEGIKFEDFALMPQVYNRASKIASTPDYLYNYLCRSNSTTTKTKIQHDILKAQNILETSEFGRCNKDIMQIFFVRQIMGSLLWAMIQDSKYSPEVKNIMNEGLRKYPLLKETVSDSTIGTNKSSWGRMLINGNYRMAKYYALLYTLIYKSMRCIYRLVKK